MTLPTFAFDYSNRTIDADGRLHVAVTNISKSNVCPYKGSEIPDWQRLGLDPNRLYRLYRDPAELASAAPTFNNIPLLSRHVPVSVDAPQHDLVVGSTGTDAIFIDPFLKNSLVIWDAVAIAGVKSGYQKELSCAYRYRADMTPGEHGGFIYDGIMRDIVGNHVALVEAGRAGSDVVVGDEKLRNAAMLDRKSVLESALKGKLAADAKIDIAALLIAMDAAGKGKDELEEKEEPDESDEEEEDREERKDDVKEAQDKRPRDKKAKDGQAPRAPTRRARDAEEDDEDDEDDKKKDEDKEAKDGGRIQMRTRTARRRARDSDDDMAGDKTKAMDAALKAVETATIRRMNDRDAAKEDVRPYVGAVMGMDSAAAVYKFALDHMKVDLADVHPSAFKAILKAQPVPGANPPRARIAMDSADDDFNKRFPGAAHIGHA